MVFEVLALKVFKTLHEDGMNISKIPYMRYVNTNEASFKFPRSMCSLNVIMHKGFMKGDFQFNSF